MRPFPVPPVDGAAVLPSADFGDAFAIDIDEADLTAPEAARRAFARAPGWVSRLLALRNRLVAPLGLKPAVTEHAPKVPSIGFFPVVSSLPERVVLGFDDKHLDFRIVVDVTARADATRRVTATTLVKRNNLFGRLYLATVMPFHKLIVPTMLTEVARSREGRRRSGH